MPANLRPHSSLPVASNEQPVLYLAFELGWDSWKLAFATSIGPAPRRREMPARDVPQLMLEIAEAKRRLRLPANCPVVSCYEAGRDSFWLHRCLVLPQLKLEFSFAGVSITPSAGEFDECISERLVGQWLAAA